MKKAGESCRGCCGGRLSLPAAGLHHCVSMVGLHHRMPQSGQRGVGASVIPPYWTAYKRRLLGPFEAPGMWTCVKADLDWPPKGFPQTDPVILGSFSTTGTPLNRMLLA